MSEEGKRKKRTEKVGHGVFWLYIFFFVISIALIGRLIHIQLFFKPDPEIARAMVPKTVKVDIEAHRGSILSSDGDVLAVSIPIYDIYMDCTMYRREFSENKRKGDSLETAWRGKIKTMCKGLSDILGEKSADEYYKKIISLRTNGGRGSKYYQLGHDIEYSEYKRLKNLPLFNMGGGRGGITVETKNIRKYPYGLLARRSIGFIREKGRGSDNTHIGIEGKYDETLKGIDGIEFMRITDADKKVRDNDSLYRAAVDGLDVRTTLDISLQDIADKALRERIEEIPEIEGACLVVMETTTGAIKVMVNLSRDSLNAKLSERENLAIGHRNEPGSVFKTVTLLSCLEDGHIKSLDETMPTNGGVIKNAKLSSDRHIKDYENKHNTRTISVLDGFKMSSNYVFATLAIENYSRNPKRFVDNIKSYGLADAFDFDVAGLRTPLLPVPDKKQGWSNTSLGTLGYGYAAEETPLQVLTFYNALAAKGRMVKPYLVESIEKNGEVIKEFKPVVLNKAICREEVADTLLRALQAVTEDGTATILKHAKVSVAGKTGTAYGMIDKYKTKDPYTDSYGRHKYNGTFVGFFPSEAPQYSIICCIFSKATGLNLVGGGIPASAVRYVVDKMYENDLVTVNPIERGAVFGQKKKSR